MSLFTEDDYRSILKRRVKESKLTWKKIAARVSVQYTYLSRALNHPATHLSEDHLHEVLQLLRFFPDEVEYILALRALCVATSESRRSYLQKKIRALRGTREINAPHEKGEPASGDVHFLLSPLTWLSYFMLGVPEYRANPRRIAQRLAIEPAELKATLQRLHDLGLIEIDRNVFEVKKINKNHFHYAFDHPLTHLHQQMLRLLCDSHYLRLPVEKRHRFMVTFNADAAAVAKIEELCRDFLKAVEKVVRDAPSKGTYQLNYELIPWT